MAGEVARVPMRRINIGNLAGIFLLLLCSAAYFIFLISDDNRKTSGLVEAVAQARLLPDSRDAIPLTLHQLQVQQQVNTRHIYELVVLLVIIFLFAALSLRQIFLLQHQTPSSNLLSQEDGLALTESFQVPSSLTLSGNRTDFLAGMSHELRTQLNAIIGFAGILSDTTYGELNSRQRRYVTNIFTSGENLLRLINDIFELAKIETGQAVLRAESFDVAKIFGDVTATQKAEAIAKQITLMIEEIPGSASLIGDPLKLRQIMHHLIANAVRCTPVGGQVKVRGYLKPAEQGDGCTLEMSVADSGKKVSPEEQQGIFEEFAQTESAYERQKQGAYLGLALTKRFVELLGGKIWIDAGAADSEGNTFCIELPFKTSNEETAPHQLQLGGPAPKIGNADGLPTIMVVEDEPGAREILDAYFSEAGYQVLYAGNGIEAVEMAQAYCPRVIVLDIVLPGKDGWDVLKELKADSRTLDIPVVILSMTEEREVGLELGAVEYFVKPASKPLLLEAVQKAMANVVSPKVQGDYSVLVVDDEPLNVEVIIDVLHRMGCKVLLAYGGQQGIDVAMEKVPDLIILDLLMPLVTGFDVVQKLRSEPKTWHIPIVVFTSKDITEEDQRLLSDNVVAIVPRSRKDTLLEELHRLGVGSAVLN